MDLKKYVHAAADAAGNEGSRHIEAARTSSFGQDMKGRPAYTFKADPTVQQLREGFVICRGALTAAIDRLGIRVIPEPELVELEALMGEAIASAHMRCLGTSQLSGEFRLAMNESQELTQGKLDAFIASQRDKRRELAEERRFTIGNAWRAGLTGALSGGVVGFVTSGGFARLVAWITRAF